MLVLSPGTSAAGKEETESDRVRINEGENYCGHGLWRLAFCSL